MVVRSATLDDLDKLLELASRAKGAALWTRSEYERGLDPTGGRVSLAVESEVEGVIGFVVARQTVDELEIENIAVDPRWQRRGAASMLLNSLLQQANQRGIFSVILEVRESNVAARTFYEKQGFIAEGRRRKYYSDPAEAAVLYRKNVPAAAPENG
jgi:[ribosomal protein S18]-alanine N-acetyltransferase